MKETSIGERIRLERERLGFTQTEFAELAGATKRSQIGWEQDEATPKPKALEAWAKVEADIVYIITGERMDIDKARTWAMLHATYIDHVKVKGSAEEQRDLRSAAFMELAKRAPTKEEFFLLANYRQLDAGGKKMVFDLAAALLGTTVKLKSK